MQISQKYKDNNAIFAYIISSSTISWSMYLKLILYVQS